MDFWGKHPKIETQNGHKFLTTTVKTIQKDIPVHNSNSKLPFNFLVEIIPCLFCGALK